ncbi:MAG: type II 3-dehydroquinate dehydratase [Phascolarctobacterium sp.]|nr:type II 3-dehydroquinate dehydratase [Candidatus Phascolarctobacterium caballi]
MKILVLNGPNMNLLGIREPDVYGAVTFQKLLDNIYNYGKKNNLEIRCLQSNHEGVLIDAVQNAYRQKYDGIVINPAAYTHTSIAIRDAIKAVHIPTVEVHISDIDKREDFRKINYIKDVVVHSIVGHGINGYLEALEYLQNRAANNVGRN